MLKRPQPLATLLAALGLTFSWSLMLWASRRGYDITDDAYYLIWASSPFQYNWSFTEFGYLVHPIYRAVGGNIPALRIAGAAILNACALIFAFATWRLLAPSLPGTARVPYLLAVLTASMWAYIWWIPNPGYNLLNLYGVLLFMAGLALATPIASDENRISAARIIIAGSIGAIGCVVSSLSRAPAAVALIVMALVWALTFRPRRLPLFVVTGVALGALILAAVAYLIDGSITGFVQRKIVGFDLLILYGPEHSLHIIWPQIIEAVTIKFNPIDTAIYVAVLALVLMLSSERMPDGWASTILVVTFSVALAASIAILRTEPPDFVTLAYPAVMRSPMILAGAFILATVLRAWQTVGNWRPFAMAIMLCLAPLASAIGSGNRLTNQATLGTLFFFAAIFFLVTMFPVNGRGRLFLAATALSSLLPPAVLIGAMANPYRVATPMWAQTEPVTIGPDRSRLMVDTGAASYIRRLQELAQAHGFRPGMPMIDLSGRSPGAVFALAGEAPGESWLNSSSTGSVPYIEKILAAVPNETLKRAWVLANPGGRLALPPSVLVNAGLDFPGAYEKIGTAFLPLRGEMHELWKPTASRQSRNP
jgi:hypothetical protein